MAIVRSFETPTLCLEHSVTFNVESDEHLSKMLSIGGVHNASRNTVYIERYYTLIEEIQLKVINDNGRRVSWQLVDGNGTIIDAKALNAGKANAVLRAGRRDDELLETARDAWGCYIRDISDIASPCIPCGF